MVITSFRSASRALAIGLLLGATAVFLSACYPVYDLMPSDFDIAFTQYSTEVNFGAYKKYFMPDTVRQIVAPGEKEDPALHAFDAQILQTAAANLTGRGYTRVADSSQANFAVIPATLKASYTGYYMYGGGYWGYWGYYPYYPYYSTYSYSTGSVFLFLNDFAKRIDNKPGTVWFGSLNGVMNIDTQSGARTRITNGINQLFQQSPYLVSAQ